MPYLFKNSRTNRLKTGKIRENDSEIDLFDPISKKNLVALFRVTTVV